MDSKLTNSLPCLFIQLCQHSLALYMRGVYALPTTIDLGVVPAVLHRHSEP